ncbi:Alpha-1,2-mannosyltransferase ALG9 [Bagarius yarrelli]|uniref:Mannosyltransferase n=1 Tax=Bagarius yarrelli TaxID=175774 RepID=A0A556TYQ9_BAGYA|nr:Alpha-1,2-mannosyltransferase ALG9 [Bagarius yarrelli]
MTYQEKTWRRRDSVSVTAGGANKTVAARAVRLLPPKTVLRRTRRASRTVNPPKLKKNDSFSSKASQVWAPEGSTAFKCLVSARFCAALLSNISDCDETFNYWEPTHYLLYGKGMQTWEYSPPPVYAIRSYAYLWLHALPACFHAKILQTNKAHQLSKNNRVFV